MTAPLYPDALDWRLDPSTADLDARPDGSQGVASGTGAIIQLVQTSLQLWRTEWHYDLSEGLPMLERVFRAGVSDSDVASVFRRGILLVPGMREVSSLRVTRTPDSRGATVVWTGTSDFGAVSASSLVPFVL